MVAATALLLASCDDKDKEEVSPTLTSTNSATANIGTSSFTSTKLNATVDSLFDTPVLMLDYLNQGGDTLRFFFFLEAAREGEKYRYSSALNTLELGFLMNYVRKSDGANFNPSEGDTGELTISTYDKEAKIVKGTFTGTLSSYDDVNDNDGEKIAVTNGKFEAKY